MKTKSLLLFLLITQCTTFFGQWEKFTPYTGLGNLKVNDSTLIAINGYSNVMISKDNGDSWSRLDTIQNAYYEDLYLNGPIITIIGGKSIGDINITKDLGQTWENLTINKENKRAIVISGDTILLKTPWTFEISLDRGQTWSLIDKFDYNGSNSCQNTPCYNYYSDRTFASVYKIHNSKIYADLYYETYNAHMGKSSFTEGGLYVSADGGKTWKFINLKSSEIYSTNIDFNSSTLFSSINSGLYSSNNDGENWKLLLPKKLLNFKVFEDKIIGIDSSNIYISTDQGLTWQASGIEFSDLIVSPHRALEINSAFVFLLSSNGMAHRLSLNSLAFKPIEFEIPINPNGVNDLISKKTSLVYPNPANDIIYVNSTDLNKIEILNLEGRTLISESNQNSVHLSTLNSGVFIVKITLENNETIFEKIVKN